MISKGGGLDSVVAVPEILAGTPEVSVDLFATLISTIKSQVVEKD